MKNQQTAEQNTNLLRKPRRGDDKKLATRYHRITPENAGWAYVGFDVYRLENGQEITEISGQREILLVWLEGRGSLTVNDHDYGVMGEREDVFSRQKPWSVYIPPSHTWSVSARAGLELAVCSAPCDHALPLRIIAPDAVAVDKRGRGANTRIVHPILMDDRPWADSLLVTEVYTPSAHWSSYPSHRHDEDNYPQITLLEETYYHRIAPQSGFGYQRIYTDRQADGQRRLDLSYTIEDRDVVLVPYGYHPCSVAYGYEMYYLNVMAGPKRQWRFKNDPDHDWLATRDAKNPAG